MSLTQFIDSSIINMEHIQSIELDSKVNRCSTFDPESTSISDEEPFIISKYAPVEDSNYTSDMESLYSHYSSSIISTSPSDSFELTDIALLMGGHLLNVSTDELIIPLPPPNLPPHGVKIQTSIFEIEPEISIVEELHPLCDICYAPSPPDTMITMPCCNDSCCNKCLTSHIAAQYEEGRTIIPCMSCNEKLLESLVYQHLGSIDKKKFTYMLVNAKDKSTIRACTNCYHVVERTEKDLKKMKRYKGNSNSKIARTACDNCDKVFCFYCQAPWHEGVSCKGFQKGDGLFKDWMKKRSGNQANAHKCPKCKVPIQRISGCPNMTCSRCHTHWCYDCGNRKIQTLIFGGHDSKWSIFGCRRYKFSQGPRYTKFVRWSVFLSEIGVLSALSLLLIPVLLALGPGIIVFGIPTLVGGIIYYNLVK
ncbi:E3 ubiquitin-protein ligase [Oopsacas minuta]|uniref:RBR-type E3 ubiquitin transferase n=1 Tax=Oopsacas minuta TaxID=111878 RepID=A0AAV7KH38_9METZ|nr:E3 ubiquitin-protein ligase [Oopsacas minuta]